MSDADQDWEMGRLIKRQETTPQPHGAPVFFHCRRATHTHIKRPRPMLLLARSPPPPPPPSLYPYRVLVARVASPSLS